LLPTTGFIRLRITALVRVRAFYVPVETRFSMRPFALRQRQLIFRSASAAGSTLLAYSFETVLKSSPDPFGTALPPPASFFSPSGVRSTYETRCQVRFQNSPPVIKLPLPSRTSRSLGLVALNLIPNREVCLCEQPDLPSLPAALEIITYSPAPRINAPVRVRFLPSR